MQDVKYGRVEYRENPGVMLSRYLMNVGKERNRMKIIATPHSCATGRWIFLAEAVIDLVDEITSSC